MAILLNISRYVLPLCPNTNVHVYKTITEAEAAASSPLAETIVAWLSDLGSFFIRVVECP